MRDCTRKHVVIFSALYLPHAGGVENYTYRIACEMARAGVSATVVTLGSPSDDMLHETDPAGFSVVRLPCRDLLGGRYPIARPLSLPRRALANLDADFVVVNTRFYAHSLTGAAFAQQRSIKPVVIDHGSAHLTLGNPVLDQGVAAVEHAMTALLKRHPADYYGVSKRSSEWLGHFGIESCGELYNSIDAEDYANAASARDLKADFGFENARPLVAFVGRLIPEKGVQELIAAARAIPSANFAIAGTGPLLEPLRAKAPRNVALPGRLETPDVAALLKQADLFCLPTRSEGFATSLLEAAACGTPAVITDVGGARELIVGEDFGTVIPNARPETIATALERALSDPIALAAQGRNARARVQERFSWKKTTGAILAACRRANGDAR